MPDPNFFGGTPEISEKGAELERLIPRFTPSTRSTGRSRGREVADYRTIGLLDMAAAIERNRPLVASTS